MPTKQSDRLISLGRYLGVICTLLASGLHLMTLFDAYGYEDLSLTAVTIQLTMICLALVAGCGAVAKQPGLLLLAFAVSFMPIGLYMLGSPGIFAFIGVANIGYAVAAMIISYGQYSQERLSK